MVWGSAVVAPAEVIPYPVEEAAKLLPRELSGFRLGAVRSTVVHPGSKSGEIVSVPTVDEGFASVGADYVSADGEKFRVELVRVERDSDAYSRLTQFAHSARLTEEGAKSRLTRNIGTTSFALPGRIAFFKGPAFVTISNAAESKANSENLLEFATAFANSLEKGEGDVPILVKHVPQWEQAQTTALYLAGFKSLKGTVPNQAVLEAITSEGDADAVLTAYGNAQFLLIEFNTPQLAGDNDRAITAKLTELRQQGQPVPTSYRKVGNYSVFVFNASSEAEAEDLINQVEYAQMVTWLGDNPYLLEQAQRDYYETTAGVLVSVVQASGLSLLACLGVGGLLGAVLFNRRRAQQRAAEAYSDAGGMLRLNLDDITPQRDPAKLLRP
ncbi:MAG TPA: DUF6599 family protein [Pyrinomonadaceae bacterium]|nr:DUF6599 family protein [Pyrinomonadaceae bacterium]